MWVIESLSSSMSLLASEAKTDLWRCYASKNHIPDFNFIISELGQVWTRLLIWPPLWMNLKERKFEICKYNFKERNHFSSCFAFSVQGQCLMFFPLGFPMHYHACGSFNSFTSLWQVFYNLTQYRPIFISS